MDYTILRPIPRLLDGRRARVVRAVLDRLHGHTYLEIGVEFGLNFLRVKAPRKIGVDPRFRIPALLKRLSRSRATETLYFEMTSDEFFAKHGAILASPAIDVAFIDGLHTYEQSLRDVDNCVRYLRDSGVIVLHDCNPVTAAIGTPAPSYAEAKKRASLGWSREWSGDVWKTIAHLRATRADLDVFVLDCDYGVGIVRRGRPASMLDLSVTAIRAMTYDDLDRDRTRILGLRDYSALAAFLETLSPT